MCADWVDGTATEWWPGRRRAVRLWRDWLASLGLILVAVMRVEGVHADGQMGVPQAQWKTLWRLEKQTHRFFPATAGWRCLWSIVGALGLHVALSQVLRPAWEHQQLQYQRQAEQAESERLAQEDRQRLQAFQEEKSRQRQQWELEQVRGLAPWRELARFMVSRPESDAPELWTGLRWAEGTWTVSGVISHEPESGRWQPVASDSIRIANLNATATTWPPEPAWGWPAWRFQWQLESEVASAKKDGS
jgi:hypothetical protein